MATMGEYKKIYEKHFGKVKKNYDIHHINHVKNQNKLWNLVALPMSLHRSYHMHYNIVKQYDDPLVIVQNYDGYIMALNKFSKNYEEIMFIKNMVCGAKNCKRLFCEE